MPLAVQAGFGLCLLLPLLPGLDAAPAEGRWPGWRGDGSGIAAATHLPLAWSRTQNVAWRTELPGEGSSSPIVWDDRVFVTASTRAGTNRLVLCIDTGSGRELWRREYPAGHVPRTRL